MNIKAILEAIGLHLNVPLRDILNSNFDKLAQKDFDNYSELSQQAVNNYSELSQQAVNNYSKLSQQDTTNYNSLDQLMQQRDSVVDGRVSNIVAQAGTDNTEIVDARYSSAREETFITLAKRLDENESNLIDFAVYPIDGGTFFEIDPQIIFNGGVF